jgi:hypothetical protein
MCRHDSAGGCGSVCPPEPAASARAPGHRAGRRSRRHCRSAASITNRSIPGHEGDGLAVAQQGILLDAGRHDRPPYLSEPAGSFYEKICRGCTRANRFTVCLGGGSQFSHPVPSRRRHVNDIAWSGSSILCEGPACPQAPVVCRRLEPLFKPPKAAGQHHLDSAAHVHKSDRHFHQSGHLRFNQSRHYARATAGPAPWGGASRWRLT